jgi:ABC-type multidrug transport system ATPase subunit
MTEPMSTTQLACTLPPLLALQQVSRRVGQGRHAHFELRVDAHLAQPAVIGVFGPNGAGKSTLMSLIAGKADPSTGQVLVRGLPLGGIRRQQRARLVRYHAQPHMAQAQAGWSGVAMALRPRDWYLDARELWRDFWRGSAPPGGPHIHLFDEPPLEPPYGGLLFDRFAQLRKQGHLVMFSTHPSEPWHLKLIKGVCDAYVFVQDGELRFIDSFEQFMADPDVADYLGALR